jgi:DNA replication protein DnaC
MGHCEKHGDYTEQTTDIFGFSFRTGCPACEKERDEIEYQEGIRLAQKAERERLSSLNIEPMYFDSTLDNFIAGSPEQIRALEYARAMVKDRAGKLVLLGSNGTGKTHLAVGIVRILGGAIFSMYEITTRIRASYVSGAKETELDIVDELARVEMLAIDEIGRTKGSDAETNWLSYIIDKRHTRGLPLMLISNKHTRKTCPDGGCQNCLENYISEDIMSRLAEDGHLVNMIGEDYRRKKRAKL